MFWFSIQTLCVVASLSTTSCYRTSSCKKERFNKLEWIILKRFWYLVCFCINQIKNLSECANRDLKTVQDKWGGMVFISIFMMRVSETCYSPCFSFFIYISDTCRTPKRTIGNTSHSFLNSVNWSNDIKASSNKTLWLDVWLDSVLLNWFVIQITRCL